MSDRDTGPTVLVLLLLLGAAIIGCVRWTNRYIEERRRKAVNSNLNCIVRAGGTYRLTTPGLPAAVVENDAASASNPPQAESPAPESP